MVREEQGKERKKKANERKKKKKKNIHNEGFDWQRRGAHAYIRKLKIL